MASNLVAGDTNIDVGRLRVEAHDRSKRSDHQGVRRVPGRGLRPVDEPGRSRPMAVSWRSTRTPTNWSRTTTTSATTCWCATCSTARSSGSRWARTVNRATEPRSCRRSPAMVVTSRSRPTSRTGTSTTSTSRSTSTSATGWRTNTNRASEKSNGLDAFSDSVGGIDLARRTLRRLRHRLGRLLLREPTINDDYDVYVKDMGTQFWNAPPRSVADSRVSRPPDCSTRAPVAASSTGPRPRPHGARAWGVSPMTPRPSCST